MNEHETETHRVSPASEPVQAQHRLKGRRGTALMGAAALGLLMLGAVGGATAWSMTRADAATFDADLQPTAIAQLADGMSPVGVQGQVAEIFGNKFIVTDGAARALVETGRKGEDGDLVKTGESVTVQGRFEHGFLHAVAIRHADDSVVLLAPPPPPRPDHGPGARHERPEPAPAAPAPAEPAPAAPAPAAN